ncbi:MAG: ribosome maturation factor RimP [Pelovirga sp.]
MDLVAKIEALISPLLEDLGFELVDIEYRREPQGWVLRFFLDKKGGITLDDCAMASRQISSLLDVEDIIPTAYHLEVSSPGLARPLKKRTDFDRFSGQQIKVKTIDPVVTGALDKARKTFTGTLVGLDHDDILLTIHERQAIEVRIPLSNIDTAHLVPEF